jgi:hypothetical protein
MTIEQHCTALVLPTRSRLFATCSRYRTVTRSRPMKEVCSNYSLVAIGSLALNATAALLRVDAIDERQ